MYAGTFVGTQKQSLDPDWIWECLCTRDLLHLHLNLKGKESSPNPHLFFSHERVRNTPMSFTSTPAVEKQEKTHLSPVICALGECVPCYWCFHLLMLQNFVCVAVFSPSSSSQSSLDVILPPFSLPFFSYRAPGVRPSDLNLSSAHIKAIAELERPPLHPCRPLSRLLLLPLSHPPVKLQTPLSCHHLFAFFCL